MDYTPLLASLCSMLEARLAFRKTPFGASLQEIVGQAIKTGNRHNSRLGIVFAQAHEQEMRTRAELITEELRKARSSWSPKQLVEAQQDLKSRVTELFKSNIAQAAYLVAQVGGFNTFPGTLSGNPATQQISTLFMQYSDPASKAAVSMVEAALGEIVAAAANDLTAREPGERPSYVYQNTFNAPVAAVAQGSASVHNVTQASGAATPQQIAEAVALVIKSLPVHLGSAVDADAEQAKHDLAAAEQVLRQGRIPFGLLQRGLSLLGKAEELAIRAPEALEHLHRLGAMLGLG